MTGPDLSLTRRDLLRGAAALAAAGVSPAAEPKPSESDRAVKALYDSLTDDQKKAFCFEWDKKGSSGLPLRLHAANNWGVSGTTVGALTKEQQTLVGEVLKSVLSDGWPEKLARQAKDDTGREWTADRKIALFGTPGGGGCQCVLTGFHLTLRAGGGKDGAAFGGAVCHGHQPSGFHEKPGHPGNIFWYQAREAHKVYELLDGKQRKAAVVAEGMPWYEFDGKIDRRTIRPDTKLDKPLEPDLRFRAGGDLPGLPVADMTRDQKEAVEKTLAALLEPYRPEYREQVLRCLKARGGLEKCRLAFYQEHQVGKDGEWDNWRLEGPAFVWYFRGTPHVHIWVHVADDPAAPVTSHFG
ncbi:MAG: hypothetical protein C0501_18965 [Isosphaera sp.]|nr:hypothetical protein [Isosphaera sp.]